MIEAVKRNMQRSTSIWSGKGRVWTRAFAYQAQCQQAPAHIDTHSLGGDAWIHVDQG